MVRRTAGHDGAGLPPSRQHPFRRQIGQRTAHRANSDPVALRQCSFARKLRAGWIFAEQDRLGELALEELVEGNRAGLRLGIDLAHINIIGIPGSQGNPWNQTRSS